MHKLTAGRLREVVSYDPATGHFHWRVRIGSRANPGERAGSNNGDGYICIGIDGRSYLASRLAWLFMTGQWPVLLIDHINGVKDDNRWENLRQASQSENLRNRPAPRHNRSGFKGVSMYGGKYWRARVICMGQRFERNGFKTAEDASRWYAAIAPKVHGTFARVS